jgi:hypothetical protein
MSSFEYRQQATPLELVDPEQGDTMLLRNVGSYLPIVEDFILQLLLWYTYSWFIKRRYSRLRGLA